MLQSVSAIGGTSKRAQRLNRSQSPRIALGSCDTMKSKIVHAPRPLALATVVYPYKIKLAGSALRARFGRDSARVFAERLRKLPSPRYLAEKEQ